MVQVAECSTNDLYLCPMLTPQYDFLVVGAGLFGATFAHRMTQRGKRCLVVDRRPHAGGNI